MKKSILMALWVFFAALTAKADKFERLPHTITQPDGTQIQCFVSGDEYFNWIHDDAGFTIIQGEDGYYYYAVASNEKIVPSAYRVEKVNPAQKGLKPHVKISEKAYLERRKTMFQGEARPKKSARKDNTGTMQGIVIYVRFSDDPEYTAANIQAHKQQFETSTTSVKNFFSAVSYGQLELNTTHIPANTGATITSYVSPHPRGYYRPYNAATNPEGYTAGNRNSREWDLIRNALEWAKDWIPSTLDIDKDNTHYADYVTFIIRGNCDGWNDLLWAHKWQLPGNYQTVIQSGPNGDVWVNEYSFQPEDQTGERTLCHEAFHVFGAPDLYHYNTDFASLTPVGPWDIMEYGLCHMSAHMKWKYGGWIPEIPELTQGGTYTLYPMGSSSTRNAYKIPGNNSEYFVLEYRRRSDDAFEANLPGTGLTVTRINRNMEGNAAYRGFSSYLDEVYVLRPNATPSAYNGLINNANLSDLVEREEVSEKVSVKPFFSNGTYSDLRIYDIQDMGDSLIFKFIPKQVDNPTIFEGKWKNDNIILNWEVPASAGVVLIYDTMPISDRLQSGLNYSVGQKLSGGATVLYKGAQTTFTHQPITVGKNHYYYLFADISGNYSIGVGRVYPTSLTVTVDTLDNFLEGDTTFFLYTVLRPNTGFITGHNSSEDRAFAERFDNVTAARLGGLKLNIARLQNTSGNAQLGIHVWSIGSDGAPDQELFAERVPYSKLNTGWTQYLFENQTFVPSDFFLGVSLNYGTPLDTFALYSTISTNEDRPVNSYVLSKTNVWRTFERARSRNIGLGIKPILFAGGTYVSTVPQLLNAANGGISNQTVNIYTTYPTYNVVCNEDWIHFSVDQNSDEITVSVDASTDARTGEILVIGENDTARCVIYQGSSSKIQHDEEFAMSLFPNPSVNGVFYLQSEGVSLQLDVFDMLGRQIWTYKTASNLEKIDLSTQQSGIYFVRITKDGQSKTFKLIKP